jgi:hypothetical protein
MSENRVLFTIEIQQGYPNAHHVLMRIAGTYEGRDV